jgi:pantoate--beta-alanine ligase
MAHSQALSTALNNSSTAYSFSIMKTFPNISGLQRELSAVKANQRIAFVPTMGNLHQGHLSLVQKAKELAEVVVVSIFVNPLQFGPNEDLDKYPRTLEADQEKLEALGVDLLFTPTAESIYPEGLEQHSKVSVPKLGDFHCGASRPGHFDGVTTVVNILFNIIQPDIAIFGQKDFQQLAIIKKMVADLYMPIDIIGCPTGRAEDGLALSSRNQYLTEKEREIAPTLYQVLQQAQNLLVAGNDTVTIATMMREKLQSAGFIVDYCNIADAKTLGQVLENTEEVVILVAAKLGQTRLIDNVSFSLNH